MVAQKMIGPTQGMMHHGLQGDISEGLSHGEGVLAGRDRSIMVPHIIEISAHIGRDSPQPRLVVDGLGESFSLAQVVEHLPEFSESPERIPQVEPEVDSLLLRGAALWEMFEGCQSLLAARHDL